MIRYIWNNWWRHPERFILLVIGMLTISSTLSYFVGVTESSNGTTEDILQKRWKAAYHIVVRPEGSRSITEQDGMLEPNYLSGLYGGISLADYELIKGLADIEIAAPLAPVGYSGTLFTYGKIEKPKETGIYRHFLAAYSNDGVKQIAKWEHNSYYKIGSWQGPPEGDLELLSQYGIGKWALESAGTFNQLLVGIDPEAEAKLVGLDKAIVPIGSSRYFSEKDKSETYDGDDNWKITSLPVLVSKRMDTDLLFVSKYERLDLPFNSKEEAEQTMELIKQNGGKLFLDKQKSVGTPIEKTVESKEAHHLLLSNLSRIDSETGKTFQRKNGNSASISPYIQENPSPLQFQKITSPYPERWNVVYEIASREPIIPKELKETQLLSVEHYLGTFRPAHFAKQWNTAKIELHWIGFYDPERLNIAKDPLHDLPIETYHPALARLTLDRNDKPVNPPITLKPTDNPFGLLTSSPLLLTTLEGAAQFLGDKPISSVRLKVKGVENVNEISQKKLEVIAKEIEKRTGLIADITLGSSPQPTLIHVRSNKEEELGWIEQIFVKLGTVFTLFRETKLGFSGIMGIVMLVAITYVFATNLVTLYARSGEFGLLMSVGWRPVHVVGIIFLEACFLGGFVSLISWAIVGTVVLQNETMISLGRVLFIGFCGLFIYILAAIPAAILVSKISPLNLLRTGELQAGTRRLIRVQGIFSLALGHLLGRFRRSLLSIFAMAVPTGLLVFFGFVTYRLQGIMYTSWLDNMLLSKSVRRITLQ